MKKGKGYLLIGFLLLIFVACSLQTNPLETEPVISSTEIREAPQKPIRIGVPADADVTDITLLIALDMLKKEGYIIETISFAEKAIEIAAMIQGDLDISNISNQLGWAAIENGASISTFIDKSANVYLAMTGNDIKTCEDLDGKSVAAGGVNTVSLAMFNNYMKNNCPDVEPQIVVMSGGSNRLAALMAGEVSAGIQDLDDLLRIERDNPGEYHPLVVFADEFPGLQTDSTFFRREFAEQNPKIIKDIIRAIFTARLHIQDPNALQAALTQYFEMEPEEARKVVDVYLAHNIWDAEFLFSLDVVKANLEFLQEFGDLSNALTPEMVADLSFYNEIVKEFQTK